MAYRAKYEPQYEDERGTEGDGYDSEEIDERHLQTALNLYKEYMSNKPVIMVYDKSLLREAQPREALSGATAQDEETVGGAVSLR
jgi:hypothetical protein